MLGFDFPYYHIFYASLNITAIYDADNDDDSLNWLFKNECNATESGFIYYV